MVALAVESVIVTDWAAVNVPPTGEMTGVAAAWVVVLFEEPPQSQQDFALPKDRTQ
jgi:hypothetical protein